MKPRTTTIKKVIETPDLVAIFEVSAMLSPELPGEPLLEPKTVKLLDEARKLAAAGDRAWLKKRGARLYSRAIA